MKHGSGRRTGIIQDRAGGYGIGADMTERSIPISVSNQIKSANQPQYWEAAPRNPMPVIFASERVQTVYMPIGKTLLQDGGL